LARASAGSSIAARMAMMAMTTSSSINVNAKTLVGPAVRANLFFKIINNTSANKALILQPTLQFFGFPPLYHAIGSFARKKYTNSNLRKAQNRADASSLFARSGNFPTMKANFVATAPHSPWPLPLWLGNTNAFGSANRAEGLQAQ